MRVCGRYNEIYNGICNGIYNDFILEDPLQFVKEMDRHARTRAHH